MYNGELIHDLVQFISNRNGIADKKALAEQVQIEFSLMKDRKVYYCRDFAIRFCKSNSRNFGNTVLSLSALHKYDRVPFIVCLVTPGANYLMLANTTFLRKISHSSQELRVDNIKGSFNGSDIMREFEGINNIPDNFESLFSFHENFSFTENLKRLVESTNHICPTGKRFEPDEQQVACILQSIERAKSFLKSEEYTILDNDLRERVQAVASEIVYVALTNDNVNLRGRIIEYLITSSDNSRAALVDALHRGGPLPEIFTADKLGDYERDFLNFHTAIDIKTKVLFLSSNPKGYNLDKVLSYLATEKSVYLIFIVAIDTHNKRISTRLCSMYHRQILDGTRIVKHWASRNSRGVTQYNGAALEAAVFDFDNFIDTVGAKNFIWTCINT